MTVPQVAKQCTSVTFPSDEATDVPSIPEITWANIPGDCGYKVSLGTNPDANNFLDGEDIGKVLSYTPEVPLQSSTTYHLRIIPYFEDEEQENCPVTSFSTGDGTEPPECTTLLYPVPGSMAGIYLFRHFRILYHYNTGRRNSVSGNSHGIVITYAFGNYSY